MTSIDSEVCEVCAESVTFCTCWRCMECEELHPEIDDSTEDAEGEVVCLNCSQAAK